ncbi:MAG TPA: hypothetical protein VK914_11830 [bacterium]|jgi:hypothetical protein|nr:hypothetical protein [bacterium]
MTPTTPAIPMAPAPPQTWLSPFHGLWGDLMGLAPGLSAALVVTLAGLAVAWTAGALASALFRILRLDQRLDGIWIQRFWIRGVGTRPSTTLARFVFYCVLALTLLLAVRTLGVNVGDEVLKALLTLLPRVLTFMLVLFIGSLLANFLALVSQLALAGAGLKHPHLVGKLVAWTTLGVSTLFALEQLGLAGQFLTQLLLIAAAGAALAFGLGCKDLAKEFVLEMMHEDAQGPASEE